MTTRFSDDELYDIRKAAATANLTLAGFVGQAALVGARHRRQPGDATAPGRDALAELQRQLFEARVAVNRTGNNLNQAVAALNATGNAPNWLQHAVERCVRAVADLDGVVSLVHRRLR